MSVLGGWLLAPVVALLLCLGIGLLAERVAGVRLSGPAIPGLGLCGLIVVAGLLTILDATAELAPWICALLAIVGLVVGRRRMSWWPVGAFAGAYALLAWPSLLSGQASIAGYIKLDDSAIWLGLIAHFMEHGRDIGMVAPSTFQLDLVNWLDAGYPIGSFTPVGVVAKLSGQDYANVYQPLTCLYGGLLALGIFGIVRSLLRSRALAVAVSLVAVQASLFAGYVWWGSIKEICVAAMLPLFGLVAATGGWRVLPLVGLVAAAFLDAFGAGGIVWVAPGCAVALTIAFRRPTVTYLSGVILGAAVLVVGTIPAIVVLGDNAHQTTQGAPANEEDLGKLFEPLDLLQGAGLWPADDFRISPDPRWIAVLLAVAGLVGAAVAVAVVIRRRAWPFAGLVGVTVIGAIPALIIGGPWIDAKVLAITAAVLLAATALAAAFALDSDGPARFAGVFAAGLLLSGCAASTWKAVRSVYIAPRDMLAELRDLGEQIDGKGPTLMLGYEGYATRYLLYRGQIEGATDLRHSLVPARTGEAFPNFSTVEVDDVDTAALFAFPLVTRRQTPTGSRPPSAYERFGEGHYFQTWQLRGEQPVEHFSLGDAVQPATQIECRELRRLAALGGELVAAPRENPPVVELTEADLPTGWNTQSGVRPVTEGTATVAVRVPRAGVWRLWLGGSARGELEVAVDGEPVGFVRHELDAGGGWMRFGTRRLAAGEHEVTLTAERPIWLAGRGRDDDQPPLGPLAITPETEPELERMPSQDVDRLCDGRTYDWVEVY